jgi:decaprenyl-phosphate phosphoribosyltransferase
MTAAAEARANSVPTALIRSMRPRQWIKNLLVVAAPFMAGRLDDRSVQVATAGALLCFVGLSAGAYLYNDLYDVAADRAHSGRRDRPIASGELPRSYALATCVVLTVCMLVLSAVISLPLLLVVLTYLALQVAYNAYLKRQPVFDLATVASGFLLRAIAGGAAADIPLSEWFLLVASFGSLFMVAGKRYSELRSVGPEVAGPGALPRYTEPYLRFVWSVSAGCAIMTYSLWALSVDQSGQINWASVSIGPFVLGVLRYAMDVDSGRAGEPEEVFYRDQAIQLLAVAWIVLLALAVIS